MRHPFKLLESSKYYPSRLLLRLESGFADFSVLERYLETSLGRNVKSLKQLSKLEVQREGDGPWSEWNDIKCKGTVNSAATLSFRTEDLSPRALTFIQKLLKIISISSHQSTAPDRKPQGLGQQQLFFRLAHSEFSIARHILHLVTYFPYLNRWTGYFHILWFCRRNGWSQTVGFLE